MRNANALKSDDGLSDAKRNLHRAAWGRVCDCSWFPILCALGTGACGAMSDDDATASPANMAMMSGSAAMSGQPMSPAATASGPTGASNAPPPAAVGMQANTPAAMGTQPTVPNPQPTPDPALAGMPKLTDPGTAPWELVPRDKVVETCQLDPDLLENADGAINRPWAVVRHGRLCHEFYPDGSDMPTGTASAGKTFGGLTIGALSYQSRDLPRGGPKTGPLSDADRVDYWVDDFGSFQIHPEALAAHVLGMASYNADISYGSKEWAYDGDASREVNVFNDVAQAVLDQDPARLGANLEEFAQKFVMRPLGLEDTVWSDGQPVKRFGGGWTMTIKDMLRIGLLMHNGGVWNGERLVAEEWIYTMTHPSFEDGHTGYGYLTWLSSKSNWRSYSGGRQQGPSLACSPHALWNDYPHRFSEAPDCNYRAPYTCEQMHDAGVWYAAGAGGQFVFGHPGLDMVLAVKDVGMDAGRDMFWNAVLPAIVAFDPMFKGDQTAFCEAYANNRYAPELRPRKAPQ